MMRPEFGMSRESEFDSGAHHGPRIAQTTRLATGYSRITGPVSGLPARHDKMVGFVKTP